MTPQKLSILSGKILTNLETSDEFKQLSTHEKIAVLKVSASALQEQATLETTAIMMQNAFNNMNQVS